MPPPTHSTNPTTPAITAPPADGPLMSDVRTVVKTLRALSTEQATRAEAVTTARDQALIAADRARALALDGAREREENELSAAKSDLEQALADLSATLTRERSAAESALRSETSDLEERAGRDLRRATKARDDAVWLAESVYDTKKDKPGHEAEAVRREVEDHQKAATAAIIAANDFLSRCRCPRIPEITPAPTNTPGDPGGLESVRELAPALVARCADLRRLVAPRLMQEIMPVLIVLALAAAGGLGVGLGLGERSFAMIAAGAGGGAALGLVAVFAALSAARSATRARGAHIAEVGSGLNRAAAGATAHAQNARETAEKALKEARDAEVKKARSAFAEIDQQVRAVATSQAAAIKARHHERMLKIADTERSGKGQAQRTYEFRVTTAKAERAAAEKAALAEHERATTLAHATYERDFSALADVWRTGVNAELERARRVSDAVADQTLPYPAPEALALPAAARPAARVARLDLDLTAIPGALPADPRLATALPTVLSLPATLEPPTRASLLLQFPPAPAEARAQAVAALNATALRLLTTHPPGKVRFTLIDPVGLGQSFAGLMHLADYFPALVSERIWSEPRHVEQRLADLTEHMETVIQKYLRNQFATIADYNVQAGEVAEPYRFLVIADFPTGFTEQALSRLAAIISAGPRCGVYTLIAASAREKLPPGPLTMKDMERAALTLAHRQGRWALLDPDLGGLALEPDPAPADDAFNALVHAVGAQSKDSGRVQVAFDVVAPPPEQRWTASAAGEVRAPLGRAGALKLQHLSLGKGTAQHALIAGRTGSGKSTLLHVIINSVAAWYDPREVEVYLIDFKKGVEFKPYASQGLPHARVIAIESEREFGLSVLRRLDEELQRRGELFRRAGVQDVAGYRKTLASSGAGAEALPRILLLIDEFQELFSEDDRLASEAALLLDRLVRQGRAFGLHVILGSQTLAGSYSLPRSTIGQMAVRIALQCSEADSYLILADDNPAARLLSRPGEAIYNDASGLLEGNSPFQVAWLDDDRRIEFIGEMRAMARARGYHPPAPIVFEGSRPADLETSAAIRDLLAAPTSTAPPVPRVVLGDPVAIKEATAAALPRQSGANLLIIGQRDDAAIGMSAAALVSLWAQHRGTAGARVILCDGTPADAPGAGLLPRLARALGAGAEVVEYRGVTDLLATLAREVREREQGEARPPIFLILHALHRFRQVRKQDDDWGGFSASSDPAAEPAARPDKDLSEILEKGPPLGVHTITWCDTLTSVERTLARGSLREFDSRVLMQVSGADSSALIDSPMAANLGPYRAVLFTESTGVLERFRPFTSPGAGWVDGLGAVGRPV